MDVNPSIVTRWLNGRLPSPVKSGDQNPRDMLIDAVADLTGVPAVALWRAALQLYEDHGDDPHTWEWLKKDQRIRARLRSSEAPEVNLGT